MEKHFLADFVEGEPGFQPGPWYNRYGDCLTIVTADEARIAERIDNVLTIYRSGIDNRPIGCQIKDVGAMIRRFGLDGLHVESEQDGDELISVSVAGLLLAAYESEPPNVCRRIGYSTALEQSGAARMPIKELLAESLC